MERERPAVLLSRITLRDWREKRDERDEVISSLPTSRFSRLSRTSRVTAREYGLWNQGAHPARLPNLRVSSLQ